METLDKKYVKRVEEIAKEIQESDILANYLETEEEEDYKALQEAFEPKIAELYHEVADKHPLQLIDLEKHLINDEFEGLYIPKILGFSILRGEINDKYLYVRPQEHFKDIVLAICNSSNFDYLKKRIGQSIGIGFSLSSDIWVTNLIEQFDNKRIKYFLQSHNSSEYADPEERAEKYRRYKLQFKNENFQTAEFPEDPASLKILAPSLKNFLIYRSLYAEDNSSLHDRFLTFIENEDFIGTEEHMQIMTLFANFYEHSKKETEALHKAFNRARKELDEFDDKYFTFILDLNDQGLTFNRETDERMLRILDEGVKDDLLKYYKLITEVRKKGFHDPKSIEQIRKFYTSHEGLSIVNEVVRQAVLNFVDNFLENISVEEYHEFFEISKIYPAYIDVFANQRFNQALKGISLKYIRRLLKHYTDKRGKDYQDIKKFVRATFLDLNFMTEKQLKELFKTRRKRRKKKTT